MGFDQRCGTPSPDEGLCSLSIVNGDISVDLVSQFGDSRKDPSVEGAAFELFRAFDSTLACLNLVSPNFLANASRELPVP